MPFLWLTGTRSIKICIVRFNLSSSLIFFLLTIQCQFCASVHFSNHSEAAVISWVYIWASHLPPHKPYIFLPSECHLFLKVVETILTCFALAVKQNWAQPVSQFSILILVLPHIHLIILILLSASLYVSKRGAYSDRLCRDVVGRWLVGRLVVGRWLSRACTVAKRCILGL